MVTKSFNGVLSCGTNGFLMSMEAHLTHSHSSSKMRGVSAHQTNFQRLTTPSQKDVAMFLDFAEHPAFRSNLGESTGFIIKSSENDWITVIVHHSGSTEVLADRHANREEAIKSLEEYALYETLEAL